MLSESLDRSHVKRGNAQNVHSSPNLRPCRHLSLLLVIAILFEQSELHCLFPFSSVLQPSLFFTRSSEMKSDYPVYKSNRHVVFALTDPLSLGTVLQMFFELWTFLDSHDISLVSPPLNDLSLSLSSLIFALRFLDSELGPVPAQLPHPSTWVQLSAVQLTWRCSDSYLWLQTLFGAPNLCLNCLWTEHLDIL